MDMVILGLSYTLKSRKRISRRIEPFTSIWKHIYENKKKYIIGTASLNFKAEVATELGIWRFSFESYFHAILTEIKFWFWKASDMG